MLVISRKKNESLVIDNDITIVVVEIRGDKVRLGIDCPSDKPVHRPEVLEAIQREQLETRDAQPWKSVRRSRAGCNVCTRLFSLDSPQ